MLGTLTYNIGHKSHVSHEVIILSLSLDFQAIWAKIDQFVANSNTFVILPIPLSYIQVGLIIGYVANCQVKHIHCYNT